MVRITEGERLRRSHWFKLHFWELSQVDIIQVQSRVHEELGLLLQERQLQTYMSNARSAIIAEGLFDDDREVLKVQLRRSLETFETVKERANQDEEEIRGGRSGSFETIAERFRALKDLQATQMQAERYIHGMLKDAGVTAERQQLDIVVQGEAFSLLAKAYMRLIWDLLPQDRRELYLERCRALENQTLDNLRLIVEGAAMPQITAGEAINDTGQRQQGEAPKERRADRKKDSIRRKTKRPRERAPG